MPWSIALGIFDNIGVANKVSGYKFKGIKIIKKINLKKTDTRHDMRQLMLSIDLIERKKVLTLAENEDKSETVFFYASAY